MSVTNFLTHKCEYGPHLRCKSAELYAFYQHHGGQICQRAFTTIVREFAGDQVRYGTHRFADGTTTTGFLGVAPVDVMREAQPGEPEGRTVQGFVWARCMLTPGGRVSAAELFDAYTSWAGQATLPRRPFVSAIKAVLAVLGAEYGVHRYDDGTRGRGFAGVALVERVSGAHLIPTHLPAPAAAQVLNVTPQTVYTLINERALGPVSRNSPRKTLIPFDGLDRYTGTPGRTARLRIVCDLLGMAAGRVPAERRAELQAFRYRLRGLRFGPVDDWAITALDIYDDLAAAAEDDPGLQQAAALMESLI